MSYPRNRLDLWRLDVTSEFVETSDATFYFRNGKIAYFRFRYRIRIVTVFVLRMRIRRKVMLKLSPFSHSLPYLYSFKRTNRLGFSHNCIALTNTLVMRAYAKPSIAA